MYIPIIKAKAGDLEAIKHLDNEVIYNTKPLIQVNPDDGDLAKIAYRINDALASRNATAYLDFADVRGNTSATLDYISNLLSGIEHDIELIPVIGLAIANERLHVLEPLIIQNGVCIRIKPHSERNIIARLESMIKHTQIKEQHVDILFDYEYVVAGSIAKCTQNCIELLTALNKFSFRSIAVASGAFLPNLGSIKADTIYEAVRYEQILFNFINERVVNSLVFSDYGNQHPISEGDNKKFPPSCSIKYTSDNTYVIFRGQQARNVERGSHQYFDKAQLLIEHGCYDGQAFSWGDNQIYLKANANPQKNPGNGKTWVAITLNRHITKIHSIVN